MTLTVWQRLDLAARHAAPGVITLFVTLIAAIPLGIPYYGPIAPVLVLMPVYYWTVHRPDLMPFWLVFLAGVLHGVLTGAPLGLHAAVLLLCQALVMAQRRFLAGKSFFVLWWGFLVTAVVATTLEWLFFGLFLTAPMPPEPVAFRALLTTALFPLFAWIFGQVTRGFLQLN